MSTALVQPAQAPASHRHADTPERWGSALKRAEVAGLKVYQLAAGRYAVTSAHDVSRAYEVRPDQGACTCPAALAGDPVCLHRAIVRAFLTPDPEPPTHQAYDKDAEALQWAYNDRERAYRDLERYTARIEAGQVLSDQEFFCFELAQQREQDASARIAELTAKIALAA